MLIFGLLYLVVELRERMDDVKVELSSFSEELPDESQRTKASAALKRIEEWNLFSAPTLVCHSEEVRTVILLNSEICIFHASSSATCYVPGFLNLSS